ncbi:MAG: hypothetical protein NTV43_08980 [Methylococcales bacterium]|nr:hypothetical protein [Methylococcales bacterium]
MKIEFIEKGASDYPLIRIYGEASFNALIDSFIKLANETVDEVVVDKLPGYEAINGCHLLLAVGSSDEGITNSHDLKPSFKWVMTRSSWDDLAALAEPFYKFPGYCFQWLAGSEVRMANLAKSSIALVISTYPDGQW